jgi:hypothetical protein
MKKKSSSKSGFINARNLGAVLLCAVGTTLAMFSFASTPSSGTLTNTSGPQTYTAGPFNVPNPTPVIEVDSGPECNNPSQPCDDYALTVTLPAGYHAANPNAAVKVTLSWNDAGSGQSDYDLYIFKNPRNDCSPSDCTVTNGSRQADFQSASGANPEVASISPLADGTQKFTLVVVPFTPSGETATVKVELLSGASGCPTCGSGFGGPDPTTPGVPRYQNFYAPPGSAKPISGEFNIGFSPLTHHIFAMNRGPVWRLTPPEFLTPAQPECCEALWEDKESSTVDFGLDPILWTDQHTGRTFISNSTAGANAVYAYTDAATPFNDGDQWVPFAPSPPNLSDDHETIGSGKYPNIAPYNLPGGFGDPTNTVTHGEAVYYCGQQFPAGAAFCQRSDSLGASFATGVVVYNGTTSSCSGLHGHVHVAPDGTVWLPVPQCGSKQGGALSADAGVTWTEFTVPGTKPQANGADPSIAIDANNTVYYAYVNNESVPTGNQPEGHAHVKVGHRNPANNNITWSNDFDLGASHGIVNAAEIEAVGGSSGRAAVGFLGTNVAGDYQAVSFAGQWYAFIATTYDGGITWTTVNATPNDPVQSMTGIWQAGGSAQDRNLLDFNEITIDDKGRVLYGYSDGCVSSGCIAGTASNDFVAFMRVARQFGGKPILSQFDTAEPVAPKPPCLSGTRDVNGSHLKWKTPDNGGSDITGYQILRSTTSGSETVIVANTANTKNIYNDTTADPAVPHYFYVVKAINGQGNGIQSNEIDLTVGPIPPPVVPYSCSGINVVTDPAGDAINPAPGGQGPVSQGDITAVSFSADATNLTTKMTIANLSATPLPGNTFTSYYVVWTSSDGITYGTEVDVGADPATILYNWGHWDSANNRLTDFNGTTGTFNTGVNGTITVAVPRSSIGSPTIPITDPAGIPAVRNPFGLTIAGEGAVGTGTTWLQPIDRAPDNDLGPGQSWAICPALQLSSVVSRKVHGSAGTFDINLPLTGARGVECRAPGQTGTTGVDYKLVFNFATPVASCGTPSAGATVRGPTQNQCTVNLTGLTNAQYITVTLNGVVNATGATGNASVTMGLLMGDTTANGFVNSSDISQTQSQSGQPVTASNFREDVTVNGAINSSDISYVQSLSGTALPTPPAPETQPASTTSTKRGRVSGRASQ